MSAVASAIAASHFFIDGSFRRGHCGTSPYGTGAPEVQIRRFEISDGERSVGEIQPLVGIESSHLSQQLAVLRRAALVNTRLHNVRAVVRATRSDAMVLAMTAIATVAFDLIVAVEIGIAVAAVLALRNVARTASVNAEPAVVEIAPDEAAELLHHGIATYRLDGALFFGAAQRFLTELTAVSDVRVVVLRLPQLQVLDATGAQALGEIVSELEARGITVLVKGARPEHLRTLTAVGALDRLAHENHLFEHLDDALAHARRHAAGLPDTSADLAGLTGPDL